jgi:hypothetical protein
VIDEYILGLKVPMQYSFRMNVCDSIENFLQNDFDLLFIGFVLFVRDELFQIKVVKFKDYLQHKFLGLVFDVQQGYDVGMLFECFKE